MRSLPLLICMAAISSVTAGESVFFEQGSPCRYLVPIDGSLGTSWTDIGEPGEFDGWTLANLGLGYDSGSNYQPYIETDLHDEMHTISATVYVRVPFEMDASTLTGLTELTIGIRAEDGYVAYLNGVEVDRLQTVDEPIWNSGATSNYNELLAEQLTLVDLSEHLELLQEGTNMMAFHAMNSSASSSDFLLSPKLLGNLGAPMHLQITNIERRPVIQFDNPRPATRWSFTVGVETGRRYRLEVSTDLTTWVPGGVEQTAQDEYGMRMEFRAVFYGDEVRYLRVVELPREG